MLETTINFKSKEWQIQNSSLAKTNNRVTYDQCRKYACEDICKKTMITTISREFIIEIPKEKEFHFIGRVSTVIHSEKYKVETYYNDFKKRDFISFSTISNKNISHYPGKAFLAYNIFPEDIVHIFPLDSGTLQDAKLEEELTWVPSLWLTLEDLEKQTNRLKVYNQITCKTKRKGNIIKPIAVIAFNEINEEIKQIANEFQIGCIIIHPDKNAINYTKDLLFDKNQLAFSNEIMKLEYGIEVSLLSPIRLI